MRVWHGSSLRVMKNSLSVWFDGPSERDLLEHPGVDVRLTLKYILNMM